MRLGKSRSLFKQTRTDSFEKLVLSNPNTPLSSNSPTGDRILERRRRREHDENATLDAQILLMSTGQVNIDDVMAARNGSVNKTPVSMRLTRQKPPRSPVALRRWSEKEEYILSEIRNRLKEKFDEHTFHEDTLGDRKLIRFIRGHEDDIDRVCRKVSNYLDWRKTNNIDEIRQKMLDGTVNCINDFPYAPQIFTNYDQILVWDKRATGINGDPIIAESALPDDLWERMTVDEYMEFRIYCLEYLSIQLDRMSAAKEEELIARGYKSNDPYGITQQLLVIRDVTGIGLSAFTGENSEAWERQTKLSSDNYPEILQKCYVCNAPWFFIPVWNAAQIFLAPRTVEKVGIHGNDFFEYLSKDISADAIPTFLGGELEMDYDQPFDFSSTSYTAAVIKTMRSYESLHVFTEFDDENEDEDEDEDEDEEVYPGWGDDESVDTISTSPVFFGKHQRPTIMGILSLSPDVKVDNLESTEWI